MTMGSPTAAPSGMAASVQLPRKPFRMANPTRAASATPTTTSIDPSAVNVKRTTRPNSVIVSASRNRPDTIGSFTGAAGTAGASERTRAKPVPAIAMARSSGSTYQPSRIETRTIGRTGSTVCCTTSVAAAAGTRPMLSRLARSRARRSLVNAATAAGATPIAAMSRRMVPGSLVDRNGPLMYRTTRTAASAAATSDAARAVCSHCASRLRRASDRPRTSATAAGTRNPAAMPAGVPTATAGRIRPGTATAAPRTIA